MPSLTPDTFIARRRDIKSFQDQEALLGDAIEQENEYRRLFSTHRDSWEVPEVTDPRVGLVDVYANTDLFKALPKYAEDTRPRCFELGDKRLPEGAPTIVEEQKEFETSWDCFTESQLRFLDWSNVFAAGGSVGACMAPLPEAARTKNVAQSRKERRAYFHDKGYPGSDVDLFLYGLNQEEAEKKLLDIYQAVQAANPYEVICFRSAHAVTLVSQYPFRHIQVVLRLYNSPAEVLMGFDVDACACGYDGQRVLVCPRTVMAFATQGNIVDMSRRSPSYEMRLSKYAQRGFEVVVPTLNRSRVDPFIYEKRFDQVQGLARLLMLEKLRTPEARFQYKQEQQLKNSAKKVHQWRAQREMRKILGDRHNLERMETNILATADGAEISNYSTVFLAWGPAWNAAKVRRVMAKKDRLLNSLEFGQNGRVGRCTRKYRLHVCFFGTMDQVLENCFPDDPPIPADVPPESLQQCVHGRVSWLVDNPGRQQIGSFHPITEGDWTEGTYLSDEVEKLIHRCAADDAAGIADLLKQGGAALLERRDFLGRSALHVAALGHCPGACKALLSNAQAAANLLQSRLADGRLPLHLAAMHGFDDIVSLFCEKRRELAAAAAAKPDAAEDDDEEGDDDEDEAERPGKGGPTVEEILDIDGADWEVKLSPLQYAVVFGHKRVVEVLLKEGASIKKIAVHKDKNMSLSILSLCKDFACGSRDLAAARDLLRTLIAAGASTTQVNLTHQTVWHELADSARHADVLQLFLEEDAKRAQTIDILDNQKRTPLLVAVQNQNAAAVRILLANGASPRLSEEEYAAKQRRAQQGDSQGFNFGMGMRHFGMPGASEDAFRVPVISAVQNGDVETLKAFLDCDATLVHATLSAPNQRTKSLLDVAEEALKAFTREPTESKMLENCQKRVAQAKEALAKQAAGSYGERLWSYVLHQEEGLLSSAKEDEEPGEEEQDPVARAQAVVALIKERGGQPHPVAAGEDASSNMMVSKSFGLFGHRHMQANVASRDPLADHGCIDPTWIRHMLTGVHWRVRRLPKGDQQKAHELFEAAWAGSVDGVRAFRATLSVFVVNANGLSPMHACVLQGHAACAKALMEVAQEQHVKEPPKAPAEGDLPGGFASQIKRLNNLDLASGGGVPKDSGPSPEDMRRRLEALEVGISAAQNEGEKDQGPVKSTLVPLAFLMQSCAIRLSDLPPLKALFDRAAALRAARGEAEEVEEDGDKAGKSEPEPLISLHPLELAVIRGDLQTLETLLAYIPSTKPAAAEDAKKEDDEGEAHEEDEEEGDDEEREEDTPQSGPQVWRQWRQMLLEHQNQSLWNLDLLSLAAVMDNPQVFLAVAAKVEEKSLPIGALRQWRLEVKRSEEKSAGPAKEAPTSRPGLAPFAMDHIGATQHPTLLQLALWWGAPKVAELLLSGGADATLLGWINAEVALLASKPADRGHGGAGGNKGFHQQLSDSARRWLVTYLVGKPEAKKELAGRLIGPTAVDAQGRSAIFYASPKDLPRFLALGPEKGGSLEQKMRGGLTPVLSAAGWGDEERLCALLEAKASPTVLAGKLKWNILHLALNCTSTGPKIDPATYLMGTLGFGGRAQVQGPVKDNKWERPFRIMQAVLQRVSPEVAQQLLLAPEAEHTPLMLALEKRADPAVLQLLAGKGGPEVLARRNFRMSNALHLAATEAPPDVEAVKLLVDLNQAQGAAGPLSPDAENARGNTPLELAMHTVVQVWEPNVRDATKSPQNVRGMAARKKAKRMMLGGKKDADAEVPRPTDAHTVYATLDGASKRASPGHRIMVGFDVVKEAANRSTAEVQKAASPSPGGAPEEDEVTIGGNLLSLPIDLATPNVMKSRHFGHVNAQRFPQIQEG